VKTNIKKITPRCDICGKFQKITNIRNIAGEDECWNECKLCMSQSDLERYFKEKLNE